MSLTTYVTTTFEVCSDLDKLSLISSKQEKTLFSSIVLNDKIYRVLPKNIETVRDSAMVSLVTYCACLAKNDFIQTDHEIDRNHIIDCDWQPAASFFQGIIRGITGILKKKPLLEPLSKTPWSQGVWYVQSRLLNNLKLNQLALSIPKITGIFSFTAAKGKGLTMAENISLVTIVNKTIDSLTDYESLVRFCTLSPEVLRSRQVLKHKQPSSKKMMYWPGEINYLSQNLTPKLLALEAPLSDLFRKVTDVNSYKDYLEGINHFNRSYSAITAQADQIASSRYSTLFRKGLKGDQATRLESLEIDELNKLCPVEWDGLQKPILITRTVDGIQLFLQSIDEVEKQVSGAYRAAFNDWRIYVSKVPEIVKGVKALEERRAALDKAHPD